MFHVLKAFDYFGKVSVLDICQFSEYASEVNLKDQRNLAIYIAVTTKIINMIQWQN